MFIIAGSKTTLDARMQFPSPRLSNARLVPYVQWNVLMGGRGIAQFHSTSILDESGHLHSQVALSLGTEPWYQLNTG